VVNDGGGRRRGVEEGFISQEGDERMPKWEGDEMQKNI